MAWGRELKLKAKNESRVSYLSFKRCDQARYEARV